MSLPPDPNSFVKELKLLHFTALCLAECSLSNLTLPLNTEFYGWKVGGDYNVASNRFIENQLPLPMRNSSQTDLKKKIVAKTKTKETTNNVTRNFKKMLRTIHN